MTLTEVRMVGGPLDGNIIGWNDPLPNFVLGEELEDLVEGYPALRAGLAGGEYVLMLTAADAVEFDTSPLFVWRDVVQTGNQ
jgi:hypothetical protein